MADYSKKGLWQKVREQAPSLPEGYFSVWHATVEELSKATGEKANILRAVLLAHQPEDHAFEWNISEEEEEDGIFLFKRK